MPGTSAERLLGQGQRHFRQQLESPPCDPDYTPVIVTRVLTRVKALLHELLPFPVDQDDLTSPTSSLLTPSALSAFIEIPGDFPLCLPFTLLAASRHFKNAAVKNPSDVDVLMSRAVAAEALAKLVVREAFKADSHGNEQGYAILSTRFQTVNEDDETSLPRSALESAVDQDATLFLSSNEVQRCIFALWKGLLVQQVDDEDGTVRYRPHYESKKRRSFLDNFDPIRIAVPRYQYILRLILHITFLAVYSLAVQTPQRGLSPEDVVLYVMMIGYIVEGLVSARKIGLRPSVTWWTSVNVLTYTLMTIALAYRLADMLTNDVDKSDKYRLLSFQYLSCASPLLFSKLVTIFDMHRFFGIMQIVVFRMLRSSSIFFALLAILAVGFAQALSGLDIDSKHSMAEQVVHHLMQALLGSPAFDKYKKGTQSYPFGIILYYLWSTLTLVILLNVLVALFSSAYEECTKDAGPTYLAFVASKTLAAIRAPDEFVYVAPFNLVEGVFIAPLEYVLPKKTYTKLNRRVMSVLFFLPISCIAFYESRYDPEINEAFEQLQSNVKEEFDDQDRDPKVPRHRHNRHGDDRDADDNMTSRSKTQRNGRMDDDGQDHLEICKVSFAELKKRLPDTKVTIEDEIMEEIRALRKELRELREQRE